MSNKIPTAHIAELFPGIDREPELTVSAKLFSFGIEEMPLLHPHEQLVLAAITRKLGPRIVVEFGTAQGQTTMLLAANSPAHAKVLTVDLDPARWDDYSRRCLRGDATVGECYRRSPYLGKVDQILRPDSSTDPADLLRHEGSVDFLLIDGDHSYRGVRHDTEVAFKLATAGATFAWHDFYMLPDYIKEGPARRGVYPYLNELASSGEMALYHIAGTYLVVGRKQWTHPIQSTLHEPGRLGAFRERIVRLGDT